MRRYAVARMQISADAVLRLLDRRDRPVLATSAIARALDASRGGTRALGEVLRQLASDGRIERTRGGWRLARDGGLVEAVCEQRRDGSFVALDEAGNDYEITGAIPLAGERILVEPVVDATQRRAEVVRAIGGARREWVGILGRDGRDAVVTPYRDEVPWELRVPRGAWKDARFGDVVVAFASEPRKQPRRRPGRGPRGRRAAAPLARVVEVLGPPGTPDADFRAIVWRHRLPREFPKNAVLEADALPDALDPAELARRMDLRALPFVTIDPATARDHDDAVCVEPLGDGGFRLWVAIADVSHFVAEGGALDLEARRRGNSVYFPDRAIPMLPERLSGELCSLRPQVDRLVLVAELTLDARGAVHGSRFHEAVIRSRARLVYDAVAEVMEGRPSPDVPSGEATEQLAQLAALAPRLTKRRFDAGAIDFDLPSAEIVLGDEGHPTDIIEAPRTIAHRAIEESMLLANRAVAEALVAAEVPALYRVHEAPTPVALASLRALLDSFGLLDLPRDAPLDSREIAAAVQRAVGRPEERVIHFTALRSMRPARYDARCLGHFALAFDAYLHFTSPIRRYADLVVHRALRDLLAGGAEARARAQARAERMPAWAVRTSLCERTAMDAEREVIDLKKGVFLRDRLGDEFEATITRVARHGFYATLDDFFVDGLVPLRTLRGHYEFDEPSLSLVGRGPGQRFALGDRVRIAVAQVDLVRGWIDFALLDHEAGARHRKTR
jgi:ribonuclease R